MATTTNADFSATTDGLTVAAAFPERVKDRTILITGVNRSGVGYTTAEAFASQGPRILIFAGRTLSKLEESINALRVNYPNIDYRPLVLDLSSQQSCRGAAKQVMDWTDIPKIDILVNNAGVMAIPERTLTPEGVELHFATNHIGHFLFTNLIMPKLIAASKEASVAGGVRIINVSSVGTWLSAIRFSDLTFQTPASDLPEKEKPSLAMMRAGELDVDDTLTYHPMLAYGHSKTANIVFSVGLNQKLFEKHGIVSLSLHPGEMETELTRTVDREWYEKATKSRAAKQGTVFKTNEAGSSTTMVAALDPKLGDGKAVFLNNCQVGKAPPASPPPYASDPEAAVKLWEVSEGMVEEKFDW